MYPFSQNVLCVQFFHLEPAGSMQVRSLKVWFIYLPTHQHSQKVSWMDSRCTLTTLQSLKLLSKRIYTQHSTQFSHQSYYSSTHADCSRLSEKFFCGCYSQKCSILRQRRSPAPKNSNAICGILCFFLHKTTWIGEIALSLSDLCW